VVSVFLYLL